MLLAIFEMFALAVGIGFGVGNYRYDQELSGDVLVSVVMAWIVFLFLNVTLMFIVVDTKGKEIHK